MLEFLALAFKLVLEIWTEVKAERAAARARGEAYSLTQQRFADAASRALVRLRMQAKEDSALAGPVDDQVDGEIRRQSADISTR